MKKLGLNLILLIVFTILFVNSISASSMYYSSNSPSTTVVYSPSSVSYDRIDTISSSIDYHSNQERIIVKREYSQNYEPRFQYSVEYKYRPVIYYRYTDVYVHPDYYVYPSNDDRYKRNKYYSRYYDMYDDQYYDSYSLVRVYNKKCDWHSRYYISDC